MPDIEWLNPNTLLWASSNQDAPCVVMGIPLDETTSFRPGTRFGPAATRQASVALEDYSLWQRRTVISENYYDIGDLALPMGSVELALEVIERAAEQIVAGGRKFMAIGGEHLITYPLLKAALKAHPDLVVIQFDAHADLRPTFTGTRYSHATVMRRIIELLGPRRVFQLGIRSITEEEWHAARGVSEIHFLNVLEPLESIMPKIKGRPVYLTIDIDVADPAFAPGTGAPEPGGITSRELLEAVAYLAGSNVVAADLVEVAPAYDTSGQTGLLAAAVVRECLLLLAPDGNRKQL